MTRLNQKRSTLNLAPLGDISRIAREEGVSRQAVWQRLKLRADNAARGIETRDVRQPHHCSICGEEGHTKTTHGRKPRKPKRIVEQTPGA